MGKKGQSVFTSETKDNGSKLRLWDISSGENSLIGSLNQMVLDMDGSVNASIDATNAQDRPADIGSVSKEMLYSLTLAQKDVEASRTPKKSTFKKSRFLFLTGTFMRLAHA